jgi:hypothetical protein
MAPHDIGIHLDLPVDVNVGQGAVHLLDAGGSRLPQRFGIAFVG